MDDTHGIVAGTAEEIKATILKTYTPGYWKSYSKT